MRLFPVVAITLFLTASDALATLCFRPDPPRCADYLTASSSGSEFDNCRSEIESFRDEVREFIDCQGRERDEVLQELEDEVRQFNDCARDRLC